MSHFDQCSQRALCWLILCQFNFPVDVKVICKMVSVRLAYLFIYLAFYFIDRARKI